MQTLRDSNLERLGNQVFDVLVIGAGINGAVSAAALGGKGAHVALIDKGDFASFTSQSSSNLAWGGIKYLESYEFGLVRKLCLSRNHLMRSYPSTVQEIRFLATIDKGFRHHPRTLFAGTWLYWFMGNGFTRTPRYLSADRIESVEPIINTTNAAGGVEYSDAFLHDNDARFVFLFVRRAMNSGCAAANYVEAHAAERRQGLWHVEARDRETGRDLTIRARAVVNATGPFVDLFNQIVGQQTRAHHVFSKGIHLIVDRLTPHRRVLTFFADDGRLFFAIPMGPRTCIGTTDTRVPSPYAHVTDEDRQFVLDNINKRLDLDRPLTADDVIAERCGVRPLVVEGGDGGDRDWMQLSRKHKIELNEHDHFLSIFGGKLTDCINVGNEVCELLRRVGIHLPEPRYRWYGEPPHEVRDEFFHQARLMRLDDMTADYASEPLSTRLWRRYGMRALLMLEKIREDPRRGEVLIAGTEYIRVEIEEAARREMVVRLEDFLRRRSKIAQVVRHDDIRNADGLMEACEVLFGDQARARYDEYFARDQAAAGNEPDPLYTPLIPAGDHADEAR